MVEGITLGIALLGAVLGIINTFVSVNNSRVKLKVNPADAYLPKPFDERKRLAVDITNLSLFAITITEVGLYYHNNQRKGIFEQPIITDGGSLPRRLEPRQSFTILSEPGAILEESFNDAKCVFVKTACGVIKTATSNAFEKMVSG